MKLPDGTLKKFNEETGIPVPHLSGYVSGSRHMSKKRALFLEKVSHKLGYDFTAVDWIFNPEKIKAALNNPTSKANQALEQETA